MRIHARDVAVGDILQMNDWQLHIVQIERDNAVVAVLTAELGFLIHFCQDDIVTVQASVAAA
jgi:hypothetical protein